MNCSESFSQLTFYIFFLQTPHLGGPGLRTCGLSDDECQLVQRFDPTKVNVTDTGGSQSNEDTIGFFIAKFIKKKILQD